MVIQNFSRQIIEGGIFRAYIAAGFFATLIFFVLNSHLFTPFEMMFGTIIVTIAFKGISNMMISLVILLFNLQGTHDEQAFKIAEDKLDLLMHQMKMNTVESRDSKNTK